MSQLIKEKINYMVSIEKNSFTTAQPYPADPTKSPTSPFKSKKLKNPKKSPDDKIDSLSPLKLKPCLKNTFQRGIRINNTPIESYETRKRNEIVKIKKMFFERVYFTINSKKEQARKQGPVATPHREFKTLASYNYQVS